MEALWNAAAAGRPYALVLLDSRLPDTDGLSLVRRIRGRARLPTPQIVLLTTGDSAENGSRSRERVEVDAEWLKPIRQEDMLEGIAQIFSRSSYSTTTANGAVTAASAGADSLRLDDGREVDAECAVRVLVVDDDEFSANFVRELLIERSCSVTMSANGREALAVLERGDIDLMLLDVRTADTDGFDVVRIVREREHVSNEHLPVIALTARSPLQDRDRCFAAGVDDVLSKPVRPAELLAAIARLTSKASSPTQGAAPSAAAAERQSVGIAPDGHKR
jgi:CheY-like chemotaxis protein